MSRLQDLIRQIANSDPQLAKDLQGETDALADRRAFGLNFERHVPEAVELPGRPVRRNDKVRILPDRGEVPKKENDRLYRVTKTYTEGPERWADVVATDDLDDASSVPVNDLVVVAEFRDPIYPGLVSTGTVARGGDKPFHTVMNAENYHALQALLFTHRGKVDAIYIDPPYNTGAKDWKYSNDYVESDDHYRHSKWLAFMERRLVLAKELLNPQESVLIVTIDEKECLRLGLLLEQIFPEARVQMVSSIINPKGSSRRQEFARSDEYLFFVLVGSVSIRPDGRDMTYRERSAESEKVRWAGLMRQGANGRRSARPNLFYPIFVENETHLVHSVGDPLPASMKRSSVTPPMGTTAVWPISANGNEATWGRDANSLREFLRLGYVKRGRFSPGSELCGFQHLQAGQVAAIASGDLVITGRDPDGSVVVEYRGESRKTMPGTAWHQVSHSASEYGSTLLTKMMPDRRFPFPKSLYAVEDALRFFVRDKPSATIVDFFAGSGTTAHAVMRLNKQDAGYRRCISITNNEVAADEQRQLRHDGWRPGDPEWERWGICEYITKPRVGAAITGKAPDGDALKGDYSFADEFPMADGFEENVEFFTLTYESALRVSSNREFTKIAPFLWLRAGAHGRRIDAIPTGWDVANTYGVIVNLDLSETFVKAVVAQDGLTHVFIVTDEDRLFEAVVRQLPEHVEPVRLYSSYLRNFEIEAGRAAR